MSLAKDNHIPPYFRLYLLKIISNIKEIRCEKCNSYENLELHHTKYSTEQNTSIKDIQILCGKCHRNQDNTKITSSLKTIFENGKRFCVMSNLRFEY